MRSIPLKLINCVALSEILGRRAWGEQELLEILEEIPTDSIYYHVFSTFLRHKYITGPHPNDFANWAANPIGDDALRERLGIIDPYESDSAGALRWEIVTIHRRPPLRDPPHSY